MSQGIVTSPRGAADAPPDDAAAPALAPQERRAELAAIREMMAEMAESAAALGIEACIPLIAAADLAVEDALGDAAR